MSKTHRTPTHKNPLHGSALRANDLTVNRRVIVFHREEGVCGEYTVVSRPHLGYLYLGRQIVENQKKYLVVSLRDKLTGYVRNFDLAGIGVIPYAPSYIGWNHRFFTIDARKRHLLPEPDLSLMDLDWGEYYEEEVWSSEEV